MKFTNIITPAIIAALMKNMNAQHMNAQPNIFTHRLKKINVQNEYGDDPDGCVGGVNMIRCKAGEDACPRDGVFVRPCDDPEAPTVYLPTVYSKRDENGILKFYLPNISGDGEEDIELPITIGN